MPEDELKTRIRYSDTSFLRHLDLENENFQKLFRLGRGAPFYFYYIFKDMGLKEPAQKALLMQWNRGKGIWKEEAGLIILTDLLTSKDYSEAEEKGKRFIRQLKSYKHKKKYERIIIEALYWQKKDEEVLKYLKKSCLLEKNADIELMLFESVSNCRLLNPGWQDMFRALFRNEKCSSIHVRAFSFLNIDERHRQFSPGEYSFFRAKALLYRGKAKEAVCILEKVLPGLNSFQHETVLKEMASAYFVLSDYSRGALFFESLTGHPDKTVRLICQEMAGRLNRKMGSYKKAEELLREVMAGSTDADQKDRALWFYLDMARRNKKRFVIELKKFASEWKNPAYFSDILDEEISEMSVAGSWSELESLYQNIKPHGPKNLLSRLAFLVGRVTSLGLLQKDGTNPEDYYRDSMSYDPDGYYGRLACALLSLEPGSEGVSDGTSLSVSGNNDLDHFLWGFFDFGLSKEGYKRIMSNTDQISDDLVLKAAGELNMKGFFIESIRIMSRYNEIHPSTEALKLKYPRGYLTEIEEIAKAEGIPSSLFYALVREESHFDPNIVSRTGAVGLTQLMPETSEDMARILRIKDYDLEDPQINLLFGAKHLSRLLSRLKSIPKSLMAYNAGLSRLRRWEKQFHKLPADLLVEVLPYKETQGYIRKILVSAIHYGALYYDKEPEATVFSFYPELAGEEE